METWHIYDLLGDVVDKHLPELRKVHACGPDGLWKKRRQRLVDKLLGQEFRLPGAALRVMILHCRPQAPVVITGERQTYNRLQTLCMSRAASPLSQGPSLRNGELHAKDILIRRTVDNPVRRIALVVAGIHLSDPAEVVEDELVVKHADEIVLKHGHE